MSPSLYQEEKQDSKSPKTPINGTGIKLLTNLIPVYCAFPGNFP